MKVPPAPLIFGISQLKYEYFPGKNAGDSSRLELSEKADLVRTKGSREHHQNVCIVDIKK
jgi:hypothetical protein